MTVVGKIIDRIAFFRRSRRIEQWPQNSTEMFVRKKKKRKVFSNKLNIKDCNLIYTV